MNRQQLMKIAQETVTLGDKGNYDGLKEAIAGTISYPYNTKLPIVTPRDKETKVIVKDMATLEMVKLLIDEGCNPVALNFASAIRPGGGFLKGTQAQEEYLARNTLLYHTIKDNDMYDYHKENRDAMYTDWIIYSPNVPVIRDEYSNLLNDPYTCSIITSPAVNKTALRGTRTDKEIVAAMKSRIQKILMVAVMHKHDAVTLGAFGCGVFGNDPEVIAGIFKEKLDGQFKGVFKYATFAVLDHTFSKHIFNTFREVLAQEH